MTIKQIDNAIRELQNRIRVLTAERKAAVLRQRLEAKTANSSEKVKPQKPTIWGAADE